MTEFTNNGRLDVHRDLGYQSTEMKAGICPATRYIGVRYILIL